MEILDLRSPGPSGALIVVLQYILGTTISIGDGVYFLDTSCTFRLKKLHVEDAEGADDTEGAC